MRHPSLMLRTWTERAPACRNFAAVLQPIPLPAATGHCRRLWRDKLWKPIGNHQKPLDRQHGFASTGSACYQYSDRTASSRPTISFHPPIDARNRNRLAFFPPDQCSPAPVVAEDPAADFAAVPGWQARQSGAGILEVPARYFTHLLMPGTGTCPCAIGQSRPGPTEWRLSRKPAEIPDVKLSCPESWRCAPLCGSGGSSWHGRGMTRPSPA